MIIAETHIGEYNSDNLRHKGLVMEAETDLDVKIVLYFLENKEFFRNLCESEFLRKNKEKNGYKV